MPDQLVLGDVDMTTQPAEPRKRAPRVKPEPPPPAPFPWVETREFVTKSGWRVKVVAELVQTVARLREVAAYLEQHSLIGYDTETSGLKPSMGARIVGHCLGARSGENTIHVWYVPVRHVGIHNACEVQLDPHETIEILRPVLEAAAQWAIMHHAKFEFEMARADGCLIGRQFHDTSLLATIDNENEHSFALKKLSAKYVHDSARDEEKTLEEWMKRDARGLGIPFKKPKESDQLSYLERFGYARTPVAMCGYYGCYDVAWMLMLYFTKYHAIPTKYPQVTIREHKVSVLLHNMEWNGLPANKERILEADRKLKQEVDYWYGVCRDLTGDPDFESSDEYLHKLLYGTLGLKPLKYTKNDAPSVDRDARLLLVEKHPEHKPLLRALNRCAQARKLHNTYATSFLRFYSEQTGKIHPSYNQLEEREEGGVPVTGRLGSSTPNGQNIASKPFHLYWCKCVECVAALLDKKAKELTPEELATVGTADTISIRRYFYVPKGYVRVYIDFSQIELRVLAWFSRDPRLVYCYQHDLDVHQMTSEEVTGGDRHVAKQVNFGNSYGMTKIGLARRMVGYYLDPEGTTIAAEGYLQKFFETYSGILQFRHRFASEMRQNGAQFVNPFGRPRRIPQISAYQRWERERGERMMMSSIISGTSADIMKESMIRCDRILQDHDHGESQMVQSIHDELAFDLRAKPGWTHLLVKLVRAMEDWPQFSSAGIPIKVTAELAISKDDKEPPTWEDKRKIELLPDDTIRFAA